MPDPTVTDAIILAAGRGERLWPYGDTNAKAALSVGTRPLIHYQLDALAACGIRSVVVVTGHLEGQVRHACASWPCPPSRKPEIRFVTLSSSRGTAHSALLGITSRENPNHAACIVPGDLYFTQRDLLAVKQAFGGTNLPALVTPMDERSVQDHFRAEVEKGTVREIVAHSRECGPKSRRLTRLFVSPPGFGDLLAATPDIPTCVEIGGMPPVDCEVAETLHQFLSGGGTITAVEAKDEVIDIDKPWDLLSANMVSAARQTGVLEKTVLAKGAEVDETARIEGFVQLGKNSRIGPGVVVYGNLVVGENTEITDGAFIEDQVVVGDDCKIWRGALVGRQTVIGHRCHVGHGAEFEGVMMDNSYSYHYGEYWGILGRCSDLGAATVCGTLRFDDGETVHRVRGRKEVPRHHSNATYLGDYVRTGVNAILMPGVKVGCYSLVGAGVLLSGDLPNNTSVYVEQTQRRGTWGPERYGW